jgi:hypothetical protein
MPGMDSNKAIDLLGGTTAAALFFEVKKPSVSEWRLKGMPRARAMYLRVVRPDIYAEATKKVGAGKTAKLKTADAQHAANVRAATKPAKKLDLNQLTKAA